MFAVQKRYHYLCVCALNVTEKEDLSKEGMNFVTVSME